MDLEGAKQALTEEQAKEVGVLSICCYMCQSLLVFDSAPQAEHDSGH